MKHFDPIRSMAEKRHHFGEHGGVNMSIETSTTFTVLDAETMPDIFSGRRGPEAGGCFLYGRHFNPTVYVLGKQLAAMEGTEAGYCAASGMGAISAVLMQLCNAGDRVVSSRTVYGGTFALLNEFLPKKVGLDVQFVDLSNLEEVERAVTSGTRVLYAETLSNPTLRLADIPRLAEIAHAKGATLVVDNTFTPLIFSPIQMQADIVVHSLTKFINGSSDVVAGAICGSTSFVTDLMDLHGGALMLLGPTMDPRMAYEISMRLPHLGLRMTEHSHRALEMAKRLEASGVPVVYPGLPSHPDHEMFGRLAHPDFGFGGMFCIDLGTLERAEGLMEVLQNDHDFGYMAVSLGYFDTLMSCPGISTSSEMPEDERERAGIQPGLVRVSVGYTGTLEQRWEQLERGLQQVGVSRGSTA